MSATSQTIVIKIGTSSICDEKTQYPRLSILSSLIETIVQLRELGHRVVLVTSGAIGMGMRTVNLTQRPKHLAQLQALAGIGQCQLMTLYYQLFHSYNIQLAQILLSRGDINDRTRYLNGCNTLKAMLDMNVIPIVNENDTVSVAEIKFGDNDTLSAVVTRMVQAQWLYLMTDVDGLYSDNPKTNPQAYPLRVIDNIYTIKQKINISSGAGSNIGTGGMITKLIAAELATTAGCTVMILSSNNPKLILTSMNEPDTNVTIGTRFLSNRTALPDKKWWVLHGLQSNGIIIIDKGAQSAIIHRASLLPIGVIAIIGQFSAQQAVYIVTTSSDNTSHENIHLLLSSLNIDSSNYSSISHQFIPVAKGIANYSAFELRQIIGKQSNEIESILGYAESDSVVERGSLVLLDHQQHQHFLNTTSTQ